MLTRALDRVRAARAEHGFTLIELLTAMVAGVVVLGALATILEVTARQTTRSFSTVDASGHARSALEEIENELHSACVGPEVTPIQAGSNGTSLVFISQYGSGSTTNGANSAQPMPAEHTITFNAATSTLTDTTTQASSGSDPSWTFGGTSTTRTLLSNVTTQSGASSVFQYFAYAEPKNSGGVAYTDAAGNPYEMLIDGINAVPGTSPAVIPTASPLTVPLSSGDAANTAEVLVKLLVKPTGGTNENTTLSAADASVQDQIVLRLTPAPNDTGSGATFDPCQ